MPSPETRSLVNKSSERIQAHRQELHHAGSRREGDRQGEVRRRLPRRRHAVLQAAAESRAARAREASRCEHGAGDARRQSDPYADDLPAPADSVTDLGVVIKANTQGEKALTKEPLYQGEPILAVAAVDELTAAEAIEKIDIEFEPLPFVVDPLDSLRPGGPNARARATSGSGQPVPPAKPGEKPPSPPPPQVGELKWTAADFAEAKEGRLPMGKAPDEWSYGDVDAGFKNAALVLDETFSTPNTSHQTLEPRTAMAYWQNGKVFIHMGTQSTVQTLAGLGRWLNMDPKQIVLISEYTGGGFGSKATGYIFAIIPALLAKKANAPVMMRISREEEHFIGRARPGFQGRMKVGFAKEGRITALDMFAISNNGPYDAGGDAGRLGTHRVAAVSAAGDALARRDGADQHAAARRAERAGRHAGHHHDGADPGQGGAQALARSGGDPQDQCAEGKAPFGPPTRTASGGTRPALSQGSARPRRRAVQVEGTNRAAASEAGRRCAASASRQHLLRRLHRIRRPVRHQTRWPHRHPVGHRQPRHRIDQRRPSRCRRDARRAVGKVRRHLGQHQQEPAVDLRLRRQPDDARDDARGARRGHGREEEAAGDRRENYGGKPEQYEVANERVFRKGGGGSMTLAQAAQTRDRTRRHLRRSRSARRRQQVHQGVDRGARRSGPDRCRKDKYPHDGQSFSYVASFAEVEVDVETGKYHITDFLAVADVGTVIHPKALGGQVLGRSMLGIGHAIGQKWVFDPQYGHTISRRFHHTKPPTILDVPTNMQWAALDIPDPETPVGARGIGEPPVGGGCGAILNALSDALGDEIYRRAPVNLDTILTSLEAGRPMQDPLTAFI